MPRGKPGSWQHGTESGYHQGCRLECCKAAHREYNAERREQARSRARKQEPAVPGLPSVSNRERPYVRRAKGSTLEELLEAW